jgi:hypothetical protein
MRNGIRLFRAAMVGALLTAAAATWAVAQNELGLPDSSDQPDWLQRGAILLGVAVLVALAGGATWVVVYRARRPEEIEGIYLEPAVVGSKFEQLLSEIQGLSLRVQGGESKGYYRKIEQLMRIFLERIGFKDARNMQDEEIESLLIGGEIQQDMAAELKSIFQRCKQGAIHETEKLDFSAADLLKDLRTIVKRVEQAPSRS